MKCPKCHKEIEENTTVCPHCHKVISLCCPNCKNLSQSSVCESCGYPILIKCSKCGKKVSTAKKTCKCGFPVKTSIAFSECESDEFAAIVVKFGALRNIRKLLASQDLFVKFYYKLNNLLTAQLKGHDGKVIQYNDTFVVNFNKELSFVTSANKAVRFALKLVNSFSDLNQKTIQELGSPLNLSIMIFKKKSEQLLEQIQFSNNVKPLNVKKEEKKFLKGTQIILDQFVRDCVMNDFKTDSLYSIEQNGISLSFYEIKLDSYVLPPSSDSDKSDIQTKIVDIKKKTPENNDDIFSFKVFDINALCKFKKITADKFFDNFEHNKIISIRTETKFGINISTLVKFYEKKGFKTLHVSCTEEMSYKPWGVFDALFRDYNNLSIYNPLNVNKSLSNFRELSALLDNKVRKAASPEDARFAYMEDFGSFIASLKDYVVIIEGFEFVDDTTIQTLELYFDRFKNVNTNFVFITGAELAVHEKIKPLLRTTLYTEYTMQRSELDVLVTSIKEEASDFIDSFYYEKIKDNYSGSKLYFDNAIKYLFERDVLITFENRLLIKNNASVMLPNSLEALLKARLKLINKNMDASLILAYSTFLGARIDIETLKMIGIKDIDKNISLLEKTDFLYKKDDVVIINNYNIVKPIIESALKQEVVEFLSKNILANLGKGLDDTTKLLTMGKLAFFKEEYLLLWKNSQFAINVGDYDAYLKNCLGFLSLVEHIENNISPEDIENNKKEVYQNILMCLYNYSPTKIYSIENLLLMDAIAENDNEKIVKLSNLMLQGALISANYTDALALLHNILSRMPNPMLQVDGAINTKFFLLSLVHIEILFNIGDFAQCIDISEEILNVLSLEVINKIKPASFSSDFFKTHILETLRLVSLAKIFRGDTDLGEYFAKIKTALSVDLPEKDALVALQQFFRGQDFVPSNVEKATPFAKIIYLILQEFTLHKDDYKNFAQNIYQAKLLAVDIHQQQLELFCDLLIAYAYSKVGIVQKAEVIYNDILNKTENSAIFNIFVVARYLIALLKYNTSLQEEALNIVSDTLAILQKYNNTMMPVFVLLEKLFIEIVKSEGISSINLDSEEQKLAQISQEGTFVRL